MSTKQITLGDFKCLLTNDLSSFSSNPNTITNLNNIEIIKDSSTEFKCFLYTNTNKYSIIASDNSSTSYLGCMTSSRLTRPGENWHRGSDLPDGELNSDTWQRIITAILRYELVSITKPKKQNRTVNIIDSNPGRYINNHISIIHTVKGGISLKLYNYQNDMVNFWNNNNYSILLHPRQCGETTIASAYLLWYAMYHNNSNVCVYGHHEMILQTMLETINTMYYSIKDISRVSIITKNKKLIEFKNGSSIEIMDPSNNKSSKTVSVAYFENMAFIDSTKILNHLKHLKEISSSDTKFIFCSGQRTENTIFNQLWKYASIGETNDQIDAIEFKNLLKSLKIHWSEYVLSNNNETLDGFKDRMIDNIGCDGWNIEFEGIPSKK